MGKKEQISGRKAHPTLFRGKRVRTSGVGKLEGGGVKQPAYLVKKKRMESQQEDSWIF